MDSTQISLKSVVILSSRISIIYVMPSTVVMYVYKVSMAHITLVPKTDNATKISDFRPISLLDTSVKILTKLLANRLQLLMPDLVHKNQYGFIKHRSIQDCIAWSLKYLH